MIHPDPSSLAPTPPSLAIDDLRTALAMLSNDVRLSENRPSAQEICQRLDVVVAALVQWDAWLAAGSSTRMGGTLNAPVQASR